MKLNKVLCLFLMVAVVFTLASCVFGQKEFTVTFNSDGGSEVASQTVAKDTPAVAPADPTKAGYTFAGWFNGENQWNFSSPVKEDLTLTAHWTQIPIYSITYMDGTTKLDLTPASFSSESTGLTLPTPAAKAHYTFKGWYSDAGLTKKVTAIDTGATADLTLYAAYTPVDYTITYNLDGGTNASSNPTKYNVEKLPTELAAPTKNGYEFAGWFTDADCTVAFSGVNSESIANLVVYAKWEKTQYTVSYYVDGTVVYTEKFTEDDGLSELFGGDKPGYSLNGWYSSSDLTGALVTSIPAGTNTNVDLYGSYVLNTYTVKYYDGDTLLTLTPDTYQISTTDIDLPALPDKEGATKLGWYTADGVKVENIAAGTYGDLVLYATYKSFTYSITYHLNGGENSDKNVAEYDHGTTPTLYNPLSRDGYLFCGWYDNADFEGDPVEDLSGYVNVAIELYAKWTEYSDDNSENLTPEAPF